MKPAGSSGCATAEPVQAEGIIAAIVGALSGGGGVRLLGRLVGPERDAAIAEYYRGVIKALQKENTQLRDRLGRLEDRILELELAQDHPPAHLS
jgi:hypothetical protein